MNTSHRIIIYTDPGESIHDGIWGEMYAKGYHAVLFGSGSIIRDHKPTGVSRHIFEKVIPKPPK